MAYESSYEYLQKPHALYQRWYKRWWGKAIIFVFTIFFIIFLAIVLYISNIVIKIRKGELSYDQIFASVHNEEAPRIIDLKKEPEGRPFIGAQNPQLIIYEFIDYECPDCRVANEIIKQVLKDEKYKDAIRIEYRNFPLIQVHQNSLKAAMAAECAHEQGKYEAMHDKLLENQQNLSVNYLKLYSVQLELDAVQFSVCLDSNKYLSAIDNDFQEGVRLGVNIVPTFVLGNQILEGVPTYEEFLKSINASLFANQ